jgi:signal transduction histidine kinase
VSKFPIRSRLTAVFVAVMAGMLLVIGLFLYFRTKHVLDHSINAALRTRQSTLRTFAETVPVDADDAIPSAERFAQILTPDGRILNSHPDAVRPMLSPAELARAARELTLVDRGGRARFLAGPARVAGHAAVVVTGASLEDREEALTGLRGALLVGLPLALLAAAAIGYALAASALKPVEAIRRRAETIFRADPSARVPVPETEDEVQRLAQTLNEMLQRLARAAAQERAFAASASHELRTPLAALRAELELALRHGTSADDLRAAIQRCEEDTERLIALADGLLLLARADDGPQGPHEPADVDGMLGEVAAQVRDEAARHGRVVSVCESGLSAPVERTAVLRAVRNLVDNALIHGHGTVTLSSEMQDGHVTISVQDEGRLDDQRVLAHAFDRFFRGADAAQRPGTGLGLSLVEAIARQHGGTAALESSSEGGTRALITLAAAAADR